MQYEIANFRIEIKPVMNKYERTKLCSIAMKTFWNDFDRVYGQKIVFVEGKIIFGFYKQKLITKNIICFNI